MISTVLAFASWLWTQVHGPLASMVVCRCRGWLLLSWLLGRLARAHSRPQSSPGRFAGGWPRRLVVGATHHGLSVTPPKVPRDLRQVLVSRTRDHAPPDQVIEHSLECPDYKDSCTDVNRHREHDILAVWCRGWRSEFETLIVGQDTTDLRLKHSDRHQMPEPV
jgi:hypothetical protein